MATTPGGSLTLTLHEDDPLIQEYMVELRKALMLVYLKWPRALYTIRGVNPFPLAWS